MAGKAKYPAKLTRLQIRNLWQNVQNAVGGNRTQESWLAAANKELEPHAAVVIGVAKAQFVDMKEPDEILTLRLSYEATCGAKIALVQSAKAAPFRTREWIRETASCFGEEFGKLVRKAISLPDSEDLEEDKELAGVTGEEDPAAVEPKKES